MENKHLNSLVALFSLTGQAAVNISGNRQKDWDALAPEQFKGVKLKDGFTIEKGPLVDAPLLIAEAIEKVYSDEGKRAEATNAALTIYRNELNRAFWKVQGWSKDSATYRVGYKQASKSKPARIVLKVIGDNSRTPISYLKAGIKEFGCDQLAEAILDPALEELRVAILKAYNEKG